MSTTNSTARTTEDALHREIAVLRDELSLVSGGFEARVQRRLALTEEIEGLRAEVGMNRVRSREQRDEILRLRDELASLRSHRKELQDQVAEARGRLRIDGQLLSDLIICSCPVLLTDAAAADIARDTVDELSRIGPGVTVFRGHPDVPWRGCDSPNRAAGSARYTDGCSDACAPARADELVDATILDDQDDVNREVQYGVFTGPKVTEHPFCVMEADNYAEARLTSEHVPGSWIGQRDVITHGWTTVDAGTPIR